MEIDPADMAAVRHFVDCSRRGGKAGSSGEQVARRLANTLNRIGDDMVFLDPQAIRGFCTLLKLAHGPWGTDEGKGAVFATIRQATK